MGQLNAMLDLSMLPVVVIVAVAVAVSIRLRSAVVSAADR